MYVCVFVCEHRFIDLVVTSKCMHVFMYVYLCVNIGSSISLWPENVIYVCMYVCMYVGVFERTDLTTACNHICMYT
jgi:hypothetical protein